MSVFPLCLLGSAYQWWHFFIATRKKEEQLYNEARAAQAAATAAHTAAGGSGAAPVIHVPPAPPALSWDIISSALQTAFKSVANKEVAEAFVYGMIDLINDYDPDMPEIEKVRMMIRKMRPTFIEKINPCTPQTINALLEAIRKIAETQYMIDHIKSMNSVQVNAINAQMKKMHTEFSQNIDEKLAKAVKEIQISVNSTET